MKVLWNQSKYYKHNSRTVSELDFPKITKLVEKYVKQKQQYERILVTKQEALELFKYNKSLFDLFDLVEFFRHSLQKIPSKLNFFKTFCLK